MTPKPKNTAATLFQAIQNLTFRGLVLRQSGSSIEHYQLQIFVNRLLPGSAPQCLYKPALFIYFQFCSQEVVVFSSKFCPYFIFHGYITFEKFNFLPRYRKTSPHPYVCLSLSYVNLTLWRYVHLCIMWVYIIPQLSTHSLNCNWLFITSALSVCLKSVVEIKLAHNHLVIKSHCSLMGYSFL